MYKFKANKETKELEIVLEFMNVHPSVINKGKFNEVFTREYARFEYFQFTAKIDNGDDSADDVAKRDLLADQFGFGDFTEARFDVSDLEEEIQPLMIYTLYAHGKLLGGYGVNNSGKYSAKTVNLDCELYDFYKACKNAILDVDNGAITLEDAIGKIKPEFNVACKIIDHDGVDGECKKWTHNGKEWVCRAFTTGLVSRYKLTRTNRLKGDSPLKNIDTFEKYFLMWLVTDAVTVTKKQKQGKVYTTVDSLLGRAK